MLGRAIGPASLAAVCYTVTVCCWFTNWFTNCNGVAQGIARLSRPAGIAVTLQSGAKQSSKHAVR